MLGYPWLGFHEKDEWIVGHIDVPDKYRDEDDSLLRTGCTCPKGTKSELYSDLRGNLRCKNCKGIVSVKEG